MNLKENKILALALIEEYSPTNPLLTDDEDIKIRLNPIYSLNYSELALKKKIQKIYDIDKVDGDTTYYREYDLPRNVYQIVSVYAFDRNTFEEIKPEYKILGKKIYINDNSKYDYKLEYFAYPEEITTETNDEEFDLELDTDVQYFLPYAVANDILKVDPSADYNSFKSEYLRKLAELDTRFELNSAVVEDFED